MTKSFSDKDRADYQEAERLLDLAWKESDDDKHDRLMERVVELLSPLVERNMPEAMYLRASFALRSEGLSDEEVETRHIKLIEAAALQGHAKAQFVMGQLLDHGGDLPYDAEKSAEWFRLSAEQGYPYAQWVHGMNLLHGLGVPANARLALDFIRRAAEGKFEEALKYMADAYTDGRHGFPIDAQQSQYWREKLQEPGVTGL